MSDTPIMTLEGLPVERQTHALCLRLASEDGGQLKWVAHQTKDICLAAIANDPSALQYIDPQVIDRDLMKAAILLTSELGTDTDYIIDVKRKRGENWTFYICEEGQPQITEARRKAGQTFSEKELDEIYVPLVMADSSGSVMEDLLRAGIVTETLTDVMMQKYPSHFLRLLTGYGVDDLSPYEMSFSPRSIPQATRAKLLTQELCDAAFEESVDKDISVILRVMPARFKTEKMCRQALRLNAEFYVFFPPSMMTDELWKIVLKKKPDVITEIRQPSIELRLYALHYDPELIASITQTDELCLAAVKEDPKVFQLCRKQSDEVVLTAVTRDKRNIKWLSPGTINRIEKIDITFRPEATS